MGIILRIHHLCKGWYNRAQYSRRRLLRDEKGAHVGPGRKERLEPGPWPPDLGESSPG